MTRDQMAADLYARLTSRKFVGFLLVMSFAIWNWWAGRLSDVAFQQAITAAFTVYGIAEGVSDFASNWHSTPDTTVRTTVNTGTEAPPTVAARTSTPARTVRGSQPKRPPAVLTEPVVGVPPPRRPRARPPLTDGPEGLA